MSTTGDFSPSGRSLIQALIKDMYGNLMPEERRIRAVQFKTAILAALMGAVGEQLRLSDDWSIGEPTGSLHSSTENPTSPRPMEPIGQEWATGRDVAVIVELSAEELPNPDPQSPTSDTLEPDGDDTTMITRASANLVRAQLSKKPNRRRKPLWTKKKAAKKAVQKGLSLRNIANGPRPRNTRNHRR